MELTIILFFATVILVIISTNKDKVKDLNEKHKFEKMKESGELAERMLAEFQKVQEENKNREQYGSIRAPRFSPEAEEEIRIQSHKVDTHYFRANSIRSPFRKKEKEKLLIQYGIEHEKLRALEKHYEEALIEST